MLLNNHSNQRISSSYGFRRWSSHRITIKTMTLQRNQHTQGFALIATISVMVLLVMIALAMLSLSTIELRSVRQDDAMRTAQANARMALMMAIGELQKAAGPDQRVTATASVMGSSSNPYTSGTTAVDGRMHWMGVWDTSSYSPADPDNKTFVRWLVSSADENVADELTDVASSPGTDDVVIFEGVESSGNPDPALSVKVPKVEVSTENANKSYYAYWVEDEGVKADLAWNEIPSASASHADKARAQAARLAVTPGPDHGVFDGGPFDSGVSYPLKKGSGYVDDLEKAFSPADMPLVMGDTGNHSDWLKTNRHDIAMNVRGVIADVKSGGLRRDLSLAFEMDGTEDSENATLFNQQAGEFVGNGDPQSSPYTTPGTSLNARYLFRDLPSAGNAFSDHITQPRTIVRGPSWWLLRDYANLYKRLETSGSGHAMSARAYYPNRSVTKDLVDLHTSAGEGIIAANRETNNDQSVYAYRPVRASYAHVLLGVNAIFSLVYENNQLKMVVDPFFIVWNPYNTQITAEKFALTWNRGFHGGVLFQHTDPAGNKKIYGKLDTKFKGRNGGVGGSRTSFADYANNKASDGSSANMSYLISGLTMGPGEVMIYSPDATRRDDNNANELHDELFPGMNYNATTSGIFFDEFPDATGGNWAAVTVPSSESSDHKIEILFNLLNQAGWNTANLIEASLPVPEREANELTTEANFGDSLSGWEFRTSASGGRPQPNLSKGSNKYTVSYQFNELSEKKSFAMITMLTQSTDYAGETGFSKPKMEVFSQLNVTPILRTRMERNKQQPLNLFVKAQAVDDIDNLMNNAGISLDGLGPGDNAFYGKDYTLADGDTSFPLLDIPRAPMHSLVQLSGANIGTRLFEPTHAIGNSWKPPYIPQDSIYLNSATFYHSSDVLTMNDVSWQVNDALFDRYYLSGMAPEFTIGASGYNDSRGSLNKTLKRFYGIDLDDPATAQANPALEPHVPSGTTSDDIVTELTPSNANQEGYKKIAAYSLTKGAFNVNSTSVKAWAATLKGNKDLALKSAQGTTESGTGTPFPLASTTSNTSSNNGWEKFSRLTDDQIDTLAEKIVDQVKARGPFMSLSDFINRRVGNDDRSYQGAIQEAIEQAGINGNQSTGIRASTSDVIPNYEAFSNYWEKQAHPTWYSPHNDFPYADDSNIGNRNNATGVPMEINQANILLPLAPKLTARTDTFKIRGYGEVRDANDNIIATATCEAVVQRLPEYVDPNTDPDNNEPWDDDSETPTLNSTNQIYGRRFEIRSFRWMAL